MHKPENSEFSLREVESRANKGLCLKLRLTAASFSHASAVIEDPMA